MAAAAVACRRALLLHGPQQQWPNRWAPAGAPAARAISQLVKTNGRRAFLVDTLALVRKLESQGVPTKQAEAITSAITEVLNDSLESISESFVSKAEMQKSEMLQESNISKFKSQVQSSQENHFSLLQRETEKLRGDIDKMRSELKYEIDKVTAGQRLDLNLERGRIRDELAKQNEETTELTTKLDKEIHSLKAQLEAAKYDVIKYCIAASLQQHRPPSPVRRPPLPPPPATRHTSRAHDSSLCSTRPAPSIHACPAACCPRVLVLLLQGHPPAFTPSRRPPGGHQRRGPATVSDAPPPLFTPSGLLRPLLLRVKSATEGSRNTNPPGKMSLISQSVVQKRRLEKSGADDGNDKDIGYPIDMDAEVGKEAKLKNHNKERRKKRTKVLESRQNKEEEEMRQLESSLFGALYAPLEFGTEVGAAVAAPDQDAPLFFTDRSAGDGVDDLPIYEEELTHEEEEEMVGVKVRKPVWVDEEEERTEVDIVKVSRLRKLRKEVDEHLISGKEYEARLRGQHAKLNPFTGWANMDRKTHPDASDAESDDEGGVDDILRNNDELVVKDTVKLLPGMLEFSRLVDANIQDPSSGPINSVQFHRNGQLMLAAGLDKHLRFFQIDGKRNPKIQTIFIGDCPVLKASFLPDGSEVILSGRRKFFYSFDLVNASVSKIGPLTGREEKSLESFEISPDSRTIAFVGNEGYILLISAKTKQLIGTLKMNGSVRSLAFADGGNQLLSSGGDGHIYHWDLGTRKCIHKATDDGSLASVSLCTSQDSSLFATGSTSGIVNVYKRDDFLGGKRKPLKTIENLTTDVGEMKFNHDAQILAITSRKERNGMRLVHVPSFTVFQNWPGPRFSLHYPRCLDFSPGSGFLSVGHAGGKVLLYKLHHYQNA
ncbi:hypothetical protein BS78_10G275600 [Paspalum vaginatum]|nr:hypothetical protein BS78_10G275600 [Paspalum vaginatum]